MDFVAIDQSIIEGVYKYLKPLSIKITNNRDKGHDLLQDSIEIIMKKDQDILKKLSDSGEINNYCAAIMYNSYHFQYSKFNYQENKRKKNTPYSIDINDLRNRYQPPEVERTTQSLDEYEEQQMVVKYMRQSDYFDPIDINILLCYFGTQYNAKAAWLEVKEAGVKVSWGWWHKRLKEVKEKIPNKFKQRWKAY
jgi:hypothetical protein